MSSKLLHSFIGDFGALSSLTKIDIFFSDDNENNTIMASYALRGT